MGGLLCFFTCLAPRAQIKPESREELGPPHANLFSSCFISLWAWEEPKEVKEGQGEPPL